MADNNSPLGSIITCCDCGMQFAFHKDVEATWRKTHKIWLCPNGHKQLWAQPNEQEKELDALRAKVKELESQLDETKKKLEQETAKALDLSTRLEIWEPTKVS